MLQVSQLHQYYGGSHILRGVDFSARQGEVTCLLGRNGVGKTTLLKCLMGLIPARSGEVRWQDQNITHRKPHQRVQAGVAYVPQGREIFPRLTVEENLVLFGGIYGMPRKKVRDKITELLQELGFETERKTMVKSLPLGWKQKLAFSLAIFHEPSIVFLDEPTGGVDPVTRRQFWELIYRAADNGITVFVTTHYMDEAEYCDRVSIMVDGRIDALGSPAQLKRQFNGNSMYDVFYALARTAKRGD